MLEIIFSLVIFHYLRNYFCKQKDEIPSPISGDSYVITKKCDLCQCSLSAGSWYLEANIAYCAEDPDNPSTHLKLYYTVNMATVIYQFQEKLKTEGITDLPLFNEQIPFDAKEPDLIVEEDSLCSSRHITSSELSRSDGRFCNEMLLV